MCILLLIFQVIAYSVHKMTLRSIGIVYDNTLYFFRLPPIFLTLKSNIDRCPQPWSTCFTAVGMVLHSNEALAPQL